MRAFRPSRFSPVDEESCTDPDARKHRDQKVELYTKRAQDNLPLFAETLLAPAQQEPKHDLALL
jgi:hypothetical protein